MKIPKDPVDAIIVSLLWADWFAKQCLLLPFTLYMKYDYWSHNRRVARDAIENEKNPPTLP